MFSAGSFQTASLRCVPEGDSIARILAAAINALEPGAAVARHVQRTGDDLDVAGRTYRLADFRSVSLLGIGKAAPAMSARLGGILGNRLDAGLVITKQAAVIPGFPFTVLAGGHPIPDARSLAAGQKTLEFISALGPDDLLFCLISGGGSALAAAPLERVSLEDLQSLTAALLACGARIDEINLLRRRLDQIKGGGLVRLSNGAGIVSLILSDVVGNPLEAIASGPTAPDPSSRADALALLKKYGLRDKIPASIPAVLELAPETLKPGDPIFAKVQNVIVGSGLVAAQAALVQARTEGFNPYLLRIDLQGEARQAAFELATFLRQAKQTGDPVPPPACIVAGGETTVTLRQVARQALPGQGKGGRNTELALAAVTELVDFPGVMLVTLATDGEDGPTDAAGAVATGETYRRALGMNLLAEVFLSRNDSYSYFAALDDLLKPGPTGTNANDLVFLFVL
ncbi:MAG: DUF4147 domain-containing protein [Anaerolineales bacterium]|jgi:hydroxypyruvate reductase